MTLDWQLEWGWNLVTGMLQESAIQSMASRPDTGVWVTWLLLEPWWMELVAALQPSEAGAKSIKRWGNFCSAPRTTFGWPATRARACLLKAVFLSPGLSWGFTTSYQNPRTPTKALLSVDGCWIVVCVGGSELGTSYSTILLGKKN